MCLWSTSSIWELIIVVLNNPFWTKFGQPLRFKNKKNTGKNPGEIFRLKHVFFSKTTKYFLEKNFFEDLSGDEFPIYMYACTCRIISLAIITAW